MPCAPGPPSCSIRKGNSLTADVEEVPVVGVGDQTSHNVSLNQIPVPSKALTNPVLREVRRLQMSLKLAEAGS